MYEGPWNSIAVYDSFLFAFILYFDIMIPEMSHLFFVKPSQIEAELQNLGPQVTPVTPYVRILVSVASW